MSKEKSFFMMRHGITVANKEGYAAGSLDTPLTDEGRQQAIKAEETVFNLLGQIEYVVHSSLSRSRITAELINKRLNLPLFSTKNLDEQCFGEWRGMKWGELRERLDKGESPPKGENLDIFYKRALRGIEEACSFSQGTPLIVSHGGIFDAFFESFKFEKLDVENCALYKFDPSTAEGKIRWQINKVS